MHTVKLLIQDEYVGIGVHSVLIGVHLLMPTMYMSMHVSYQATCRHTRSYTAKNYHILVATCQFHRLVLYETCQFYYVAVRITCTCCNLSFAD